MRVSRRVSFVVLLGLSALALSSFAIAQSDQTIAKRVLGPQWKHLSRRAGMIFAGTVINGPAQSATPGRAAIQGVVNAAAVPAATPTVEVSFRVDLAIAGVDPGQILTIHEWAGAWSMHRPIRSGQHILIFLYPLSRLGLTSPVGGSLGQVDLDESGQIVSEYSRKTTGPTVVPSGSSSRYNVAASGGISVAQLERAIRSARLE